MCRDSLSVPSPRGGTGGGEPPTRCEADRSAGPRHRRGSSPCVSCLRVPVGKHTPRARVRFWLDVCHRGFPLARERRIFMVGSVPRQIMQTSEVIYSSARTTRSEQKSGISGTTRPHTKWKTQQIRPHTSPRNPSSGTRMVPLLQLVRPTSQCSGPGLGA